MAVIRSFDPKRKKDDGPENIEVKLERERKKAEGHDESNWLISYADMMTLLCVFYIMLYSMAKPGEAEKIKQEIAKDLKVEYKAPTEGLGKFLTQILQEAGVEKNAVMYSDGTSVSIAFHSTMFFDTLSAELRPEGKQILETLISKLNDKQIAEKTEYKVVVEGHTDSQAVLGGPFASNWELSSARASRVVRLFIDYGFKTDNLIAMGFADARPVAPSRNNDGTWNVENLAKNRRVVLRVLLPENDSIPWRMDVKQPEASSTETAALPPPVEPAPNGAEGAATVNSNAATGMAAVAETGGAVAQTAEPTAPAENTDRNPASADPQDLAARKRAADEVARAVREAAKVAAPRKEPASSPAEVREVRQRERVIPGKR